MKQHGFTLIEMLVVIVIISLLTGMVFHLTGVADGRTRRAKTVWKLESFAGILEEYKADYGKYPCLALARQAAAEGGISPLILNASNEVAVQALLDGAIRYMDIPKIVEASLSEFHGSVTDVDGILYHDRKCREYVYKLIGEDRW